MGADRAGIGYTVQYATDRVRAVALSAEAGKEAVLPTEANCRSGKYPLARPIYLYFDREPGEALRPLVREFLAFVHCREGQACVVKDGLVSLDAETVEEHAERYR